MGQPLRGLEPRDGRLRSRPVVAIGRARRKAERRKRSLQDRHLWARVAWRERLGGRLRLGGRRRLRVALEVEPAAVAGSAASAPCSIFTCEPAAPGASVWKGACARGTSTWPGVVGALTGGVEVETAAVAGFVNVDTILTALLPPKTPKPARIAKQRTRPDVTMMIAACVVVSLRLRETPRPRPLTAPPEAGPRNARRARPLLDRSSRADSYALSAAVHAAATSGAPRDCSGAKAAVVVVAASACSGV